MPHIHLSLQSGDDMILKRMKRRHLRAHSVAFCQAARRLRPDIVFGADLIAGFPTETEAMFQGSLDIVADCGLTYLHVFPYSPRPGTPAARMPQVAKPEIKARAMRLREAGQKRLDAFMASEIGATRSILVETESAGRTEHYAPVRFRRSVVPGAIISAKIAGHRSGRLEAG